MAAEALCNGLVASPRGDVGVAGRANKAAALAESVPIGGYGTGMASFPGGRLAVADSKARPFPRSLAAAPAGQMNLMVCKSMRWWEKGVQPNMREVESAQDLADSLLDAGDQLVVVDFFSPGCGGCRALHPKISQLAEKNPGVQFLQVNYEKHRSMCYSLHVHVLPFFRFYRGAHGRVSSFSCTNATINKLRDALAKHGTERCGLGPARGLEEPELMALAANRDLDFVSTSTYDDDEEQLPGPVDVPILAEAMRRRDQGGCGFPSPTTQQLLLLAQGSESSSSSSSSSLLSSGTGR